MKTKTLGLFAFPVIAAIMISGAIAPAYAATKLVDDVIDEDLDFPLSLCGQSVNIHQKKTGHITMWDNGKFQLMIFDKFVATGVNGDYVATAHRTETSTGTVNDAPVVMQVNLSVTCVGSGLEGTIHYGTTLHPDGSLTFHNNGSEP